jgi:hypothetical protein
MTTESVSKVSELPENAVVVVEEESRFAIERGDVAKRHLDPQQ